MNDPTEQDEGARCRLVELLAGREDEDAFGALLVAAHDTSWRVRERAVRLLTAFTPDRLVASIRETVTGRRDPSQRNAAMDALVRQGESAVKDILTLLEDEHWEIRLHGTVMLGNIRSTSSVVPLARLLADEEENVIHAAAESLGAIGDPRAVIPLVEVLSSHEFWSQYPAVIALGKIAHHSATEHLLSYLGDEMLAPAVVDALGRVADPRALQPLLALLADHGQEFSPVPSNQVLKAIVRISAVGGETWNLSPELCAPMSRAIAETLAMDDVEDRIAALLVAGATAEPSLIPLIVARIHADAEQEAAFQALLSMGIAAEAAGIELLEASDASVRRLAIRLLSEIGAEMAPLLRHIVDSDETVRMEVAMAVGRAARPDLSEYLLELLLDENDEVRRVALDVVADLRGDVSVREQLYRRLEYYPDDRLSTIVETLGRLRVADALPRLSPLMSAPHEPAVRAAVVAAVSQIGGEGACELLLAAARDADARVRVEALRALPGYVNADIFETLAAAVADPDLHCAYAAVTALGEIGDQRALALLERTAAAAGGDLGLRVAAVGALGKLGAEGSTAALLDLLAMDDPDVRREVTRALGRLAGQAATEGLVRAAADPFWGGRALAVRALAERGPIGLPHVMAALNDPEPLVRKAAVRGLAHAGIDVVPQLYPLIAEDELEDVVARTLEGFGAPIVSMLGRIRAHADPMLRIRLARLLGRIGGSEAAAALHELVDDNVAEVSSAARKALAAGEVKA